MKKLTMATAIALCSLLALTGCGGTKAETKASGSIPEKTESNVKAENKTESTIEYNTFNHYGFLVPVPTDFTVVQNEGNKVLYKTPSSDGLIIVAGADLDNDVNALSLSDTAEAMASGVGDNAVPSNEKELKIAGCDGGSFTTSANVSGTVRNFVVYYVKDPDAKKLLCVICLKHSSNAYEDYYEKLPELITKVPSDQTASTETPTPEPTQEPQTDTTGVTPELKEFLDSYEAYVDQYCDFIQRYKQDMTNAQLIQEYNEYADRLADLEKKANAYQQQEDEMSQADYNYFVDSYTRIMKKLMNAGFSVLGSDSTAQ